MLRMGSGQLVPRCSLLMGPEGGHVREGLLRVQRQAACDGGVLMPSEKVAAPSYVPSARSSEPGNATVAL